MKKKESEAATTGMEIAIIGMMARFPGAENVDEFWENLKNGVESVEFFSDRELAEAGIEPEVLEDPHYVKTKGGVLADKDMFDASFFGYSPREAELMEPQTRMFHECVWEALEDAGYDPDVYDGLIGLYAGASTSSYWEALSFLSGKGNEFGMFAAGLLIDKDYMNARVSYNLNLKGPTFSVSTACSTSLVAVHLGCRALLTGECNIALAGGITILPVQKQGYFYQKGMIASPDGHCRAFDARAEGTMPGEGVGIVVLKRLKNAIDDGDFIHAVIKGSAVNNDGRRKVGFEAPSVDGQAEVIRRAQRIARVEPETVSYIEAHGTGTTLGDPVEIEALKLAFNTDKKGFCAIGSVKSNFGHLDAAAGAAGLIKTVLALKHRIIPPSLNFETPNPTIDFDNSPFFVNAKPAKWNGNGYPLRTGVSSFGIGGTNAHVVLEAWSREQGARGEESRDRQLLLLSAKSKPALDKMTENLAEYLRQNPGINPADATYTLQVGRKAFQHRRILVCSTNDVNEAVEALSSLDSTKVKTSQAKEETSVIFMFSGLGAQYVNMGLELYQKEPIFREEMDRCFAVLKSLLENDIKETLYPAGGSENINKTDISQVVIFILEYALARLLMKWGIKPEAMIGYSFGEYTAACIAGVFSLEDALKLVVARGKLITKLPAGTMLSVPLTRDELEPLLNPGGELSLAIDNGPSCIAAGPAAAVEALEKQLKNKKILCMPMQASHAIHSKMMAPILKEYEKVVEQVTLNKPQIPYISNVTGHWITVQQAANPHYWVEHLSKTVLFADGIRELVKTENAIFIEIGPGRDLTTLVRRYFDDKSGQQAIDLVRQPKKDISDVSFLLDRIGRLWMWGVKVDWSAFYSNRKRYRIPLPTYPFNGYRFPIGDNRYRFDEFKIDRSQPAKKTDMADWFYIPSWERTFSTRSGPKEWGLRWLVFMDEYGLASRLLEGIKQVEVITVTTGKEFKGGDGAYTINPRQPDHYLTMFQELKERDAVPDKIIHFRGVTGDHKNSDGFLDSGLYSLLDIVQAVGKQGITQNIRFDIVTSHMQEVIGGDGRYPEKAAVLGAVKVIPLEYTNINCRSIDILPPAPGTAEEKNLFHQLLDEFTTESSDLAVAFRGNYRWGQIIKPQRLEKPGDQALPLREKGVYLITGGFGGMGFTLAEHLAKKVKARLVLVGRSPFPGRDQWQQWLETHDEQDEKSLKIRKLQELEEKGAEVMFFSADVSDEERMQEVIKQINKKFGRINGVLHAAGLVDYDGVIQRRTLEKTKNTMLPKIKGTWVLHRLLKDVKLDFLVLFSSIGNILYGDKFGQVGYSAANEFLDAFAFYKASLDGTYTISINWEDWLEVGMGAAAVKQKYSKEGENIDYTAILPRALTPAQAAAAFNRMLASGLPRVAVTTVDLLMEMERVNRPKDMTRVLDAVKEPQLPGSLFQRPELNTPYIAPGNEIEQTLATIFQNFLGIEKVGVQDDFFELGGDSLKALVLLPKIHKELDVEVPIADFFNRPTIETLAQFIRDSSEKGTYSPIEPAEDREYYALSSAQKRLYILQQLEKKDNISYNQPNAAVIEGEIEKDRLEATFKTLIERHESLRTSFHFINEEPVQKIHAQVAFKLEFYDLSGGEKQDPKDYCQEMEHFVRPFDLSHAPLLRVGLIKTGENQYIQMVDSHHIIADGLSLDILQREFMALYTGEELLPLTFQYRDFSQWRHQEGEKETMKRQEAFWLNEFDGEIPLLNLPGDYPRPAIYSFDGDRIYFELSGEETNALNKLARSEGATLFMVLFAVFNIFLSKISGQEDIIAGTDVAGRHQVDLENVIGMFVNTLVLRNFPAAGQTFKDYLKEAKERTLKALQNQDYPFEDLVEQAAVDRDVSRNPMFDVMFSLWDPEAEVKEIPAQGKESPGLKLKPFPQETLTAKFDMTMIGMEGADKLYFFFEYYTKIFKKETVERFAVYYKQVISSVIRDRNLEISEIDVLPEQEKKKILFDFNDNNADFCRDKTACQIIEENARQIPDRIAAAFEDIDLTYRELDERSNQLARWLRKNGIINDCLVGVLCRRSLDMLTGILAVWKAGGAYIPIDVDYPFGRITTILSNSGAVALLTTADAVPDSRRLYREIGSHTEVRHIVYLDRQQQLQHHCQLFQTSRYASLLSRGASPMADEEQVWRYEDQSLSYQEYMDKIIRIHRFVSDRDIRLGDRVALLAVNPFYKIIALSYLNSRGIPFVILDPHHWQENKKELMAEPGISTIFSESRFLDELDRLLWESGSLKNYIILDNYDFKAAEKEAHFKDIWDYVAEESSEAVNDYGWSDSYTNKPFPLEEMNEYIENFKTKLAPYLTPHARVLDIGCGHGLVLAEIAPHVGYYLATDLSPVIIEKNKRRFLYKHVELKAAAASGIDQLKKKEFDLIICSSAVHYFPNTLYLEKVLERAVDLLKDEGVIYLDDLMNLRKKQELVRSTGEYKRLHPDAQVKTEWDGDLFVDEDFFHDFQQKHPEIAAWESSGKTGTIENELTRFRYDVKLKVDKRVKDNGGATNGFHLKKHRWTFDDIESHVCSSPGSSDVRFEKEGALESTAPGDVSDSGVVENCSRDNLERINDVSDLSYVIYTSGSTGKPKGAMVEHIGMMNHLQAKIADLQLDPDSIIAQNSSHTFDISIWQFFSALLVRGKTIIYSNELVLNPEGFMDRVIKDRVNILEVVPSYLSVMMEHIGQRRLPFPFRYLLVTGEEIKPQLVEKWFEKYPGIKMVNAYGPTEASDDITHHIMTEAPEVERIPIGKPVQNLDIYIVDKNMKLCPIGARGEICVSGIGVGRGYLKDEQRTKEVFMEDSFKEERGIRLYKTGDLGRWLPDGTIEFFGRIDYQVKIRGFRIELGEIESKLASCPGIKETVVIAADAGGEADQYLCAYFVSTGQEIQVSELREYLTGQLPYYMIPDYFVPLENIPLTPNGKIDRKALPAPEVSADGELAAPRNWVEEELVVIWSEVLEIQKDIIGIDNNFFQLGGHSLKATVLVGKIHKRLNVDLPLAEIFRNSTIRGLSEYLQEKTEDRYVSIKPVEKKEYYRLSSAQTRLYILKDIDEQGVAYNLPAVLLLEGTIDKNRLENVFYTLIERHDSLRTSFHMILDEPAMRIHEEKNRFQITYFDRVNHSDKQIPGIIEGFIRPFDMSRAPLLRVGLISMAAGEHVLMADVHHIVTDGVSMGVLVKEFMSLYAGEDLPPLNIQYKDYSEWQNREEASNLLRQQGNFWLREFDGDIPVLNLSTDFPRPVIQDFSGRSLAFQIGKEQADALREYALNQGATLFMVLLALYNIFLAKLTGQEDIVVGTPIAGRRHSDLESVIGMFVNTLALRNFPTGAAPFKQFLEAIKERTLQAFAHQDYPYEELVEKVNVHRDTSRNPLFDTMFMLQNYYVPEMENPDLSLKPYPFENNVSRFDLTLQVIEQEESLLCDFEYSTNLFREDTISRYISYFKELIALVVTDPALKIAELEWIPEIEKKQLLFDFNATVTDYPAEKSIYQLFEEQVERTPTGIALDFEGRQLCYRGLKNRSSRLAKKLRAKGVRVGTIVGLMAARSLEMLIGLMGILKAGGAYLPIDPQYPAERVEYMLKESDTGILLTDRQPGFHTGDILYLDENLWEKSEATESGEGESSSHDLAYVIYTSGSTGKPKGVAIKHNNVINFITGITAKIEFLSGQSILALTTLSFDIFVLETLLPLLKGLKVVIAAEDHQKDPLLLAGKIRKEKVNLLQMTPSTLKLLLDGTGGLSCLENVDVLMVGGESFPQDLFERLKLDYKGSVYNMYGPTETTVWSAVSDLTAAPKIDIGMPISNTQIYIIDGFDKLLPVGVAGELCIGGDGLARGYLNRPELTAERFPPAGGPSHPTHPLTHSPYSTIYRTGDLARWLPDGNIECLGRIDNQVKLRGFRIELGEIESQLVTHEEIKEAVVIVNTDGMGDKYLCAYVVLEGNGDIEPDQSGSFSPQVVSELRTFLSGGLPGYMIPAYFVPLERIPLTPNGKVDRKMLPEPGISAAGRDMYVAPANEVEEKLQEIWSEVLGAQKDSIGMETNFFQVGGHSLKATTMVGKIHKQLKVNVPLREIFKTPTIRGLSGYIMGLTGDKYVAIEPAEEKEYYELSSAQKRLYILQQLDPDSTTYHMPTIVELEGDIDIGKMDSIFKILITRHEALRTSFGAVNGRGVQEIHRQVEFEIVYLEIRDRQETIDSRVKNFICPFDLSQAPLLRVEIIKVEKRKCILMVDMHHIISDGISMDILVKEFMALYGGEELPGLRIQYKDFSEWQNKLLESAGMEKQETFWLDKFKGDIPQLRMPLDFKRPAVKNFEGDMIPFEITGELGAEIEQLTKETGATSFMVLLAVYNALLHKYTGQTDIIIGSPVSGRRHADLQNILGVFVNMIAFRNQPAPGKSFSALLEEVKAYAVEAYENQDYQFEELVKKLGLQGETGRNPIFDVGLVMEDLDSGYMTGNTLADPSKDGVLKVTPYGSENRVSRFDMLLWAASAGDRIDLRLEYSTQLFKKSSMEIFCNHYKEILQQVVENKEMKLEDIGISSDLQEVKSSEVDLDFEFEMK